MFLKLGQLNDVLLFTNTGSDANIDFLKWNTDANFKVRPQPWVSNIHAEDIQSGDLLLIYIIQGQKSPFETLGQWVTGAHVGRTAVFLRDSEGNLWIGPSGSETKEVASIMTVWSHFLPTSAVSTWNEAFNKRLGTHDLTLPDILIEVEKHGGSFGELLTIPELDDWVYTEGKSTSSVSFVLQMYKEAGLFGELASSIQVNEFTIKDACTLEFFENNSSRLPEWCNDGMLPFCQIKGMYQMELPGYNTIKPYPHTTERCPSLAPTYSRPPYC